MAALPADDTVSGTELSNISLLLRPDEATSLTPDQKSKVEDLLQEFSELFGEPTGHASVEAQVIQMNPGAKPSMQNPYSNSPTKRKIMEEKVQQLIEKGYLEPCKSEWTAPSLLVAKDYSQTDFRLVTNFRK